MGPKDIDEIIDNIDDDIIDHEVDIEQIDRYDDDDAPEIDEEDEDGLSFEDRWYPGD